jgi:predicted glycosyltransferase
MYDYEFTETQIFNRFSHSVLVPERISDSVLDGIGLPADKRAKYPGIKEELYIRHFAPDTDFRERFLRSQGHGEMAGKVFVVLRPPAGTANYHSKQSDDLLEAVLSYLLGDTDVFTVIVPRTVQQADEIRDIILLSYSGATNYLILDKAVNGLDLAFASDLLISGGGTMNREAALLGVPVYSIFAGKQGALDNEMETEGLITFIRNEQDVEKIKLRQRDRDSQFSNLLTDRVERFVIEQINTFLERFS